MTSTLTFPAASPRPGHAWRTAALLGLGLLVTAPDATAEGFRNPPPGTFGLSRAGGRIAHVDDASAVTHNPANLMDLTSPQLAFEPGFVYISSEFNGAAGARARTKEPFKMLPAFFAAVPIIGDRLTLGLGLTSPYGLANEWEESGAFADASGPGTMRYQAAYYSELITLNIQPTIAVKLHERLNFAAGLDIMWSELEFRRFYPWSAGFGPGLPDGTAKANGTGTGIGANFGLTWKITDRQRLAATLRTPIDINYQGDFTIDNFPAVAALAGATPQSPFNTGIKFPTIAGIGYGVQVTEKVRLEAQFEWLEFSNFDSLPLDVANNAILFFPVGTNIRESWQDTFTVGLGGDWQFRPGWTLRGSYQFYESPVPSDTISPSIPDANQNAITIGLGYQRGRHTFEGAFSEVFYSNRTINGNQNPAFNGTYETTVHLFSLAYRFAF